MEVKPGWWKQKRESLLEPGVTEVAYSFAYDVPASDGESVWHKWWVVADHRGAVIKGESPKLSTDAQLEAFAWVLSDAMREYLKLKRHKAGQLREITPNIPNN